MADEIDFEKLRRTAHELEGKCSRLKYSPPKGGRGLHLEIKMLSYDFLLNELDKIYKVKAAKKYLKR